MKFDHIDNVLLFGGAKILADFAEALTKAEYPVFVYSCERQLAEAVTSKGGPLRELLAERNIPYISTDDINSEPSLRARITENTLGIGLGEAWSFNKDIIELFSGRLLDLMGIRMPQYRGGAHYTWQILRGTRIGASHLQEINEDMIQGVFDSGRLIKSKEYLFPVTARIPADYFAYAEEMDVAFLMEFLEDIKAGKDFYPVPLQESFSLYFPRLHTLMHGLINWEWSSVELERFICAFDSPYAGASTFLDGKRVHLKGACLETNEGPFHPFQVGLIYKIYDGVVYIATRDGSLLIHSVYDEDGNDCIQQLRVGNRFFTPAAEFEAAMTTSIEYTADGVKRS